MNVVAFSRVSLVLITCPSYRTKIKTNLKRWHKARAVSIAVSTSASDMNNWHRCQCNSSMFTDKQPLTSFSNGSQQLSKQICLSVI